MRARVLVSIWLALPAIAGAQVERPVAFVSTPRAMESAHASHRAVADGGGMPHWVKWGLVGAVGGGLLFALAGQSNTDQNHSVAGDAAYGAATGFVLIGGGVWFYDWVCSRGSRSRAAGLCGR